jgi:hypothetical protein
MRVDTTAFTLKNTAKVKRPRYVIEISFDSANTILWYFTSHLDTPVPGGGAGVTQGVIEGLSGTSQTLNPDNANATIGNVNFNIVDKGGVVTTVLGSELALGRSTRRQRVRIYIGYEGLAFSDFTLFQTQLITEIDYNEGSYNFKCADIQREMRKDLFDIAKTTLQSTVGIGDATINVFNTGSFQTVPHGTAYSDAPSATVGYVKIQDEIIRYTGKNSTQFTGCTRGVLNTLPAEHVVDSSQPADSRPAVEEYVYLELPAIDLMYRVLTGKDRFGSSVMPTKWNLGIDPSYVKLSEFTGIGADIWDTSNDQAGIVVRFEAQTKIDGKKFVEQELALLTGTFTPVLASGALGLRRMANVLAGAAYVQKLDKTNVIDRSELTHDQNSLHNVIQVKWNYEPLKKDFTRIDLLLDQKSITIHKPSDTLKLSFRGLHGSRHSAITVAARFNSIRDRYTGPPLRQTVTISPGLNALEIGDVVRHVDDTTRDFVANSTLDRSFEIQNVSVDWISGDLKLKLFGSSQAPGALAPTVATVVLSDAYYTSQGTNLTSVLTITGSNPGHVTANGTLTGTADLNAAGSIFYYNGDLVIDPGVTVNIVNNVQLRIKGHLDINGTINGKANGFAGASAPHVTDNFTQAQQAVLAAMSTHNDGTQGFIGTPESGGSYGDISGLGAAFVQRGFSVVGKNPALPPFDISWDGTTLKGLPTDLRGTSGSSGAVSWFSSATIPKQFAVFSNPVLFFDGGAGGASGAGLITIARGISFGVSGKVDTSGADGSAGELGATTHSNHGGSGAGGAPGGFLAIIDGALNSAPDLTDATFKASYGSTPITGIPFTESPIFSELYQFQVSPFTEGMTLVNRYSFYVGTGDGTTFPRPSMGGANGGAGRVIFVPPSNVATPDPVGVTLAQPSSFSLSSGTSDLLLNGDGTVVVRVKLTWAAVADARVAGYDVQFKRSADSDTQWQSLAPVIGRTNTTAWVVGIQDGVDWDFRVRAADDTRGVSAWTTITGYHVIGKTAPPEDVTSFSASQNGNVVVFKWDQVADIDLSGYEIRYGPVGVTWENGIPLTKTTKGTSVTSAAVPPGVFDFMIKAFDTSGNESVTDDGVSLTVTNELDIIFQQQQAPSWPGTLTNFFKHWTGVLVPDTASLASSLTDAELWDQFVAFPYGICIYQAPEIDIGFDDTARIHGAIQSVLGPGVVTGIADPDLEIDFHTAAGSYDGFEPWTIGDRVGRFFKHRLVLDTSEGVAIITGFLPTVDQFERTERKTVVVAAGGSIITFADGPFHTIPQVVAQVVGASALLPVIVPGSITTTQFTIHIYNTSGTSVGGTATYDAKGV